VRTIIVTADDFGLSVAVNEAVERAHREGILTAASLMVAGDAAADAVARARANPGLKVGLHLVAVEGPAMLPHALLPTITDANGQFPADQLGLALRYAFSKRARAELMLEITAQFNAFRRTGLPLNHADAHKHMHLHPVVGEAMLRIGHRFGLRQIRIPAEPPSVMTSLGEPIKLADRALYLWTRLLRARARKAGMICNDHLFGLAWTGHMTTDRLLRLVPNLPDGTSELYFHPATSRDAALTRLMPDYEHTAELETLLNPKLQAAIKALA